jgi:transposase
MKQYIGCDAHRRYSIFAAVDERGRAGEPIRVEHQRNEFRRFLGQLPTGSPVAVEASGGWYWLMTELEAAGLEPHLADPYEAKKRMRGRNKTDALDARGLAMLLYDRRLPEVWIPPARLLDLRGLMRSRLALRRHQTGLKNRILAAVNRYGLRGSEEGPSDCFQGKGRVRLSVWAGGLPEQTREATIHEWQLVDELEAHVRELERQIQEHVGKVGWVRLLQTLPGVGRTLAATIHLEVGAVGRFPTASHLASYAGLVPRVHGSGGKTYHGSIAPDANRYLKWAFIEAANCTVMHRRKYGELHVGRLYQRLKASKGHPKAVVAVGRHLAEASWWMLRKAESYREPAPATVSSSENGSARERRSSP